MTLCYIFKPCKHALKRRLKTMTMMMTTTTTTTTTTMKLMIKMFMLVVFQAITFILYFSRRICI